MDHKVLVGLASAIVFIALALMRLSFAQGESWEWIDVTPKGGEFADIVFAPSDPRFVYAGGEVNHHTLWRSEDSGKTWQKALSFGHTLAVVVHPKDPKTVYVSYGQVIIKTTDGGQIPVIGEAARGFGRSSWQTIYEGKGAGGGGPDASIVSLSLSSDDPQKLAFLIRGGGGPPPFGGGGKVFTSADGGNSWQERKAPEGRLNIIVFSDEALLLGTPSGIYRSSDFGNSWQKVDDSSDIVWLEVNGESIFAASTKDGFLRSTNGGKTWIKSTQGLGNVRIERVKAVANNPNVVYATSIDQGVFRSDDGGGTWRKVSGNLPAKNLHGLGVHPQNPDIALVATDSLLFAPQDDGHFRYGLYRDQGMFLTQDGGRNWQLVGIPDSQFETTRANPYNDFEFWVGSPASRGLFRTRDGGQTWTFSPSFAAHYPMDISFWDKERLFLTGSGFNATSANSGEAWGLIDPNVLISGLTRGKQFGRSIPGGGFGNAVHTHGQAIDPKNPKAIYVGTVHDRSIGAPFANFGLTGSHIFKSEDGGKTFKESDSGFPHESQTGIHRMLVDPHDSNTVYAATSSNESIKGAGLWRSKDAGSSWQKVTGAPEDVMEVIIHSKKPGVLLVSSHSGISGVFLSTDGGQSFRRTFSDKAAHLAVNFQNPDQVFLTAEGGVYVSDNFGQSFSLLKSLSGEPHGIAIDRTGSVLLASFNDGGVFAGYKNGKRPPISKEQSKISNLSTFGSVGEEGLGHLPFPEQLRILQGSPLSPIILPALIALGSFIGLILCGILALISLIIRPLRRLVGILAIILAALFIGSLAYTAFQAFQIFHSFGGPPQ